MIKNYWNIKNHKCSSSYKKLMVKINNCKETEMNKNRNK